ncbi:hypothetical protein BUALT_Bualt04G0070600 [Buddleja alternifolia]|uniref:ZF-HD dimerization-type domain-containing protein n=1 Tax=Buddleja alternifolia TaxID=168488 RepID=A0AAV6XM05_9LAMI|nr:hypothetical protein BUALT_Bualt04G0070600 [Buddleja alternifolia]
MERRDMGMPNSIIGNNNYNNPPQESPVKLPLAPILSTPPDRRANVMLSTRRGTSIFSPTQTLDHHNQPAPPQQPLGHKDTCTSDPDPPPTAADTTVGASNLKNPAPPPQAGASTANTTSTTSIKYRECLKNHAASMGGHIVDGCGEFMPSGDENTPEALRCAACDCHRNFHRKEINGEPQHSVHHRKTPILHTRTPHKHPQGFAAGPTPPKMVNFGGGAAAESSSEDLNMFQSGSGGHAVMQASSKKRFRTKFSQEQKDKMHEFATKIEWRIQKQNEQEVQQFCSEVGVKRQVFKVWMHNNKQAMKRIKQISD